MKNTLILLTGFVLCSLKPAAQMHYSLTPATNTYASFSGGTSPFLTGNGFDLIADEGYANNIPIGFNFIYNGSGTYNELAVSTNGFISFAAISNAYLQNNLTSGLAGERPIVAPLWDDINLQTTNNLQYVTTGTAPNRIFIMEWANARWGFGATAAAVSFQVKLYETSNWIEFNYRQESGSALAPSASIGLTASGTGSSNFLSLQSAATIPGASLSTEMATIASKPLTNQSYIFKPGVLPVSFAALSVSKSNGSHIVNWQTLNETNNAGFEVQRSVDGINFSKILFVESKATTGNSLSALSYTATDSKPIDGTNYYRLKQMDKDGRFNYSSILSIKNSNGDTWASLNIYPNPAKEKLVVQLNSKLSSDVTVSVFNMLGSPILQNRYSITAGTTQLYTDVASLPIGTYTIKVTGSKNEAPLIKTFVK